MKNQLLIFILLFSTTVAAQIGAKVQQQTQAKISGLWQNSDMGFQMVLILKEDKTGEFDGEVIKYSVVGNKLSIAAATVTTVYNFVLQNNALTLSGGDIEKSLTFTRQGTDKPTVVDVQKPSVKEANKNSSELIGNWSGSGETIEFTNEGKCNYLGQTYPYELSSGHVTLNTNQGNMVMAYAVANDQLTLTVNGRQLIYSKGGGVNQNNSSKGSVSQELVGKWCYVNVYSSSSGGSSSSNCITLNADGTYEYYGESSRSVNTSTIYGGTSSQSGDSGTWSAQGNTIYYTSQSRGAGSYQFQKQNHPKNGDPMIVIDGQTYVTFYNKPPWR